MCCGFTLQTAARATYARPCASSVWACSPGPATCCSGIAAIPSHSNSRCRAVNRPKRNWSSWRASTRPAATLASLQGSMRRSELSNPGNSFPGGASDLEHAPHPAPNGFRSEEHTSELQSLTNLVCRLLLEKKKNRSSHLSKNSPNLRLRANHDGHRAKTTNEPRPTVAHEHNPQSTGRTHRSPFTSNSTQHL